MRLAHFTASFPIDNEIASDAVAVDGVDTSNDASFHILNFLLDTFDFPSMTFAELVPFLKLPEGDVFDVALDFVTLHVSRDHLVKRDSFLARRNATFLKFL